MACSLLVLVDEATLHALDGLHTCRGQVEEIVRRAERIEFVMTVSPFCGRRTRKTTGEPNPDKFF